MTEHDAYRILDLFQRAEDQRAADDLCDALVGELALHGIAPDLDLMARMADVGLHRLDLGLTATPAECLRDTIARTARQRTEEARLWALLAPAASGLRPKHSRRTRRARKASKG